MARRLLFMLALAALPSLGCAGVVTGMVADAVTGGTSSFATDDDPELVADAAPFGLKTMESLLEQKPRHEGLMLGLASGFTQYGYAFVLQKGDFLYDSDPDGAREQWDRARRLFARAHGYGLRLLETRHPGFRKALEADPKKAAAMLEKSDVPAIYWTGASLALYIAQSKEDFVAIGKLPQVDALMSRALALDPDWDQGTLHEFFVTWDGGRSEIMGGSLERAQAHFDRALELSRGKRIGLYVTWAEVVETARQDRAAFDRLLDKALAFDLDEAPENRLVNRIAQQRARWLKGRVADLFIEE